MKTSVSLSVALAFVLLALLGITSLSQYARADEKPGDSFPVIVRLEHRSQWVVVRNGPAGPLFDVLKKNDPKGLEPLASLLTVKEFKHAYSELHQNLMIHGYAHELGESKTTRTITTDLGPAYLDATVW